MSVKVSRVPEQAVNLKKTYLKDDDDADADADDDDDDFVKFTICYKFNDDGDD